MESVNETPYIMMYHSVAPGADPGDDPYRITVSVERLERQLSWLARCGLRGVSVRELLAARSRRGLIGLTFDDGYADFLEQAVPALRRHGFTATAYVVADRIGAVNDWDADGPIKPLMDRDGVLECAKAGMEIGSHGMHHRHLPQLDSEALAYDITASRELLADLLGEPVTGYCYPFGDHDARAVQLVREAGYDYACAVGRSTLTGRYALPRRHINDTDGAPRLLAKRVVTAVQRGVRWQSR
jgi:peptidoglycan/xylan/chitin deacetylase (PgdA/CDA1 family)